MKSFQECLRTNSLLTTYMSLQFKSDKGHTHGYIEPYGELIEGWQDRSVIVCEVGVAAGYSLTLWDKYFKHTDTTIYGVDIKFQDGYYEWDTIKPLLSNRIKLIESDCNLLPKTELKNLKFDFVLDDASHTVKDQISFIKFFLPRMRSGGVLIVEDVLPDDWNSPSTPHQKDASKNISVARLLQEVPNALVIDNRCKPRPLELGGGVYGKSGIAIAHRVP